MILTKEQANLRLEKINTPEQLKELIQQLDVTGTGKTTVLWSGVAGFFGTDNTEKISSQQIAAALHAVNPDFRIVANTEASRFLELDKGSGHYNQVLEKKLDEMFAGNPDKIQEFLYGQVDEKTGKRLSKGIWDSVSENFVKKAQGDVRLVVGGGGMDRVFAQTEMRALMNNPAIKSIEGIPIEGLKELEKTSGLGNVTRLVMGISEANSGMVKLAVDGTGRPISGMNGTYRVDAVDYIKMNTLHTSVPRGMKPVAEFIPEARRLRHVQAVEEIYKLTPALRSKNYVLPVDPDPFRKGLVISRLSSLPGPIADATSLGLTLHKANAQMHAGDHRAAHDTVSSWALETAGGFVAGRVASLLVAPLMATGPIGMLIGAGIIIGSSILGGELAKKLLKKHQETWQREFPIISYMSSPLILDLDSNGVQTLAMNNSFIHFDQDNNGFAERLGWVDPHDGLLILDLNGNGKVDGGAELFGNHTHLKDGQLAENGFIALAMYDSNEDKRIDQRDPIWTRLRVWKDENSNGKTETGEWLTLKESNVRSLHLGYATRIVVDNNGNIHAQHGFFERLDGKLAALTDVWFSKDSMNSLPPDPREVDPEIAALPDFPGMGIVPSLHQSLMDPANTALRETLLKWLQSTHLERMKLTQELVFQWCKADDNPFTTPERDYLHDDPLIQKKVAVVEKLAGQSLVNSDFIGYHRSEAIISLIQNLNSHFEMVLNVDRILKPLFQLAVPVESDLHGTLQMDVSESVNHLRSQFQRDPDPAFIPMVQWLLAEHEGAGLAFFQALQTVASSSRDAFGRAMSLQQPITEQWQWLKGSAEEDQLKGSARNDFIEGGELNDTLWGQDGNDTLQGGPGIDIYYGGKGGDSYYISQNSSPDYDYISDEGIASDRSTDRLIFWELASHEVRPTLSGSDVRFHDKNSNLIAMISGQYNPQKRIEEFHFVDGVMWDYNTLLLQLPIKGTAGNDRLAGVNDTSNRLQGLEGNDTLIGGTLNDHLEGQQGNDTLTGLAGKDTLFGGQGDDLLEGGEGGDTYQFGIKASHDRIHDLDPHSNEVDRVVFNNLATTALTRVLRSGNDLVLQFGSTNTLTLVNQLLPFSRIESFAFVNGPVWSHSTLFNQVR